MSNGQGSVLGFIRRVVSWRIAGARRDQRAVLVAFRSALRAELERSRRYDRAFVLVRAPLPESPDAGRDATVAELRTMLRGSDLLCLAERHVYLLVPEADRIAGDLLVARIHERVGEGVTSTGLAMVAFPEDGLTLGALLGSLRGGTADQHRLLGHIPRRDRRPGATAIENGRKAG